MRHGEMQVCDVNLNHKMSCKTLWKSVMLRCISCAESDFIFVWVGLFFIFDVFLLLEDG